MLQSLTRSWVRLKSKDISSQKRFICVLYIQSIFPDSLPVRNYKEENNKAEIKSLRGVCFRNLEIRQEGRSASTSLCACWMQVFPVVWTNAWTRAQKLPHHDASRPESRCLDLYHCTCAISKLVSRISHNEGTRTCHYVVTRIAQFWIPALIDWQLLQ